MDESREVQRTFEYRPDHLIGIGRGWRGRHPVFDAFIVMLEVIAKTSIAEWTGVIDVEKLS
jgi:hypothetical protein